MRISISHPELDFEEIRSRNLTNISMGSFYNRCTSKIIVAGNSSREELNRSETFKQKNSNPYRGMPRRCLLDYQTWSHLYLCRILHTFTRGVGLTRFSRRPFTSLLYLFVPTPFPGSNPSLMQ